MNSYTCSVGLAELAFADHRVVVARDCEHDHEEVRRETDFVDSHRSTRGGDI